jgi:hypothetical protein
MRNLSILLVLILAAPAALRAQPYDQATIKTAAFCLGVVERMAAIMKLVAPADTPQATVDEVVGSYKSAGNALVGFIVVHQGDAGMTTEQGKVYVDLGLDHMATLYKANTEASWQEITDLAHPCRELGWVVGFNKPEATAAAFEKVTPLMAPLIAD